MSTIEQLREIEDEAQQVSKLYEIYNEDQRLKSKARRVEFLTTMKYINKYLTKGAKILDVGAGAGEYSLHYAKLGYEVDAIELSQNNIDVFKTKIRDDLNIRLIQGNALDLSVYEDSSFDIVLVFGPLYHLHNEADRQQCIKEAKRVCKENGVIFFAFISNDMVIISEFSTCDSDYFDNDNFDENFKIEDFPFVFFTVDKCRTMLSDGKINIIHEIASDGVSELLGAKINAMSDKGYEKYLQYHYYCCEKSEMLGHSSHLLFIGKKE